MSQQSLSQLGEELQPQLLPACLCLHTLAAMQAKFCRRPAFGVVGFEGRDAQSATCIMTAEQASLTADLACTFAHQKPYVTEAWYAREYVISACVSLREHLSLSSCSVSLESCSKCLIYFTNCRLQAIMQRPSLSDPPASMASHIPTVTSSLSDQQMQLQPAFHQNLLAEWSVVIPTSISQVRFCFPYPILLASRHKCSARLLHFKLHC